MARIDGFEGSLKKYCHYLEKLVQQLNGTQENYCGYLEKAVEELRSKQQDQVAAQSSSGLQLVFRLPQASKPGEKWKSLLQSFIDAVPRREEDWTKRRKLVGLSRLNDIVQTFLLLIRHPSYAPPQLGSKRLGPSPEIADILKEYTSFAKVLAISKAYTEQLSHFADVITIALGVIGRKAGVDAEVVNNCVKTYLEEQNVDYSVELNYAGRLRKGVLWPIEQMEKLDKAGLGHRSYELFFLWGRSIHTYLKYSRTEGTDAFKDHVTICKPPDEEGQASIPFIIPFICKIILDGRCSLDLINVALETQYEEKAFNEWLHGVNRILSDTFTEAHSLVCNEPRRKKQKLLPEVINTATDGRSVRERVIQETRRNNPQLDYGDGADGASIFHTAIQNSHQIEDQECSALHALLSVNTTPRQTESPRLVRSVVAENTSCTTLDLHLGNWEGLDRDLYLNPDYL